MNSVPWRWLMARAALPTPAVIAWRRRKVRNRDAWKALEAKVQEQRDLIEHSPHPMAMLDREMRYLVVSRSWIDCYGRGRSDIIGSWHYEVNPDLPEEWVRAHRAALAGETVSKDEDLWIRSDGVKRWQRWMVSPWRDEYGDIGGVIISAEDVTERHQTKSALQDSNARFSAIFHSVPVAITITRLSDGCLVDVNGSFTDLWGYTREEVVGREYAKLGLWVDSLPQLIEKLKSSRYSESEEVQIRRATGEILDTLVSVSLVQLGPEAHLLTTAVDITGRKHAERMEHLAHHDTLTELPNRLLLGERLKFALNEALAEGARGAILFIDLDRFKEVNDMHGHDAGDELLRLVSARLRASTRSGDFVARLGGDEFVVVLMDIQNHERAQHVAAELIRQLSLPFMLARGMQAEIGASVGISYFPDAGSDAEALIQQADMALYAAKNDGRSVFRVFEPEMTFRQRRSLGSGG